MGKFLNEFKQFAMRGNVLDMAVGVIIGGAFGKMVSSVVDDIIMPPIGWHWWRQLLRPQSHSSISRGDRWREASGGNHQLWQFSPDHSRLSHRCLLCIPAHQGSEQGYRQEGREAC